MKHLLKTSFIPQSVGVTPQRIATTRKPQRIQAKIREIFMPALSSTMTEGKIVSWIKSEGDKLAKGDSVVVVESDKADMDVEIFYDGFLAAIIVQEGQLAPVGSPIGFLAESLDEIALAKTKEMSNNNSNNDSDNDNNNDNSVGDSRKMEAVRVPKPEAEAGLVPLRVVATPYAKKLAREMKVELSGIVGSGPNGRIVARDVEAVFGGGGEVKGSVEGNVERGKVVAFTAMQGAVSRNMVESLSVPTFRVGYTIGMDELDALYKKIKSKGVTMTALLAKATALALAQHPVVNASCRDGQSFTYNSSINIAVAVAIDGGLITPVLENADKVDIYSLSRKWKELVDKARAKQLQPNEYSTGTFTISNLGMFGVDRFDAILPPGTGAIMAVGGSQPALVGTKDGRIGVKSQMQVNVTADHRVIYGADLASFLQTLAKIIEDPTDLTF